MLSSVPEVGGFDFIIGVIIRRVYLFFFSSREEIITSWVELRNPFYAVNSSALGVGLIEQKNFNEIE